MLRQLLLCSAASTAQCRASAPLVMAHRAYKSPALLISSISRVQKLLKKHKPTIGQDAELAVVVLDVAKSEAIYLHERAQREKAEAVCRLETEKAEAYKELAEKASKLHKADMQRRRYATRLLKAEGKLNMRGLLEFSMAEITDQSNQSLKGELRRLKGAGFWEKALAAKEYHGLVNDIAQRTGWAPNQVPVQMAALYKRLSEHTHAHRFQRSGGVLELVVGEQATNQECVALQALADHLGVPTEIVEW